ncbi:HD domain-containing protein [Desulforhopalus singaporensis]|uniref:Poly(A) polymerase n=1 Tax=Desulforhopalus singaporensis TaxID=91360 RepID=A0A1H0UKR8_9BACT|nr:HD domain-containing protein [Desulforhopalus singaporensis]SDP66751.1 poly(A) polymerase [Desulforhopalus singaporensis]
MTGDREDRVILNCLDDAAAALYRVGTRRAEAVYAAGGTLRDILTGRSPQDLDVTVAKASMSWARELVTELGGGTIVDISGPDDDAARVVWRKKQVDISSFREQAATIEQDLRLRDYTVNAIGLKLENRNRYCVSELIDPTGGLGDLHRKILNHLPGAFAADPIRMLRGYRLYAKHGFMLSGGTRDAIKRDAGLIARVARERVEYELRQVFESDRTSETVVLMDEDRLLDLLIPELYAAKGVEQPEFHHLDVFGHCLLTLQMMEKIVGDPDRFFPHDNSMITGYLSSQTNKRNLKWAALLHDVGKPVTRAVRRDMGGRVTFYRHDEEGRELFFRFATKYRWSNRDMRTVGSLIEMHMHPFHLCNVRSQNGLSRRAVLKLCRRAKDDLGGLFALAMADSLASSGAKKPAGMEQQLVALFQRVQKTYRESIKPVLQGPKLLNGKDLIELFGLEPGPDFAVILGELEVAQVEGKVIDRGTAVEWVEKFLGKRDLRPAGRS